jgi:predicted DNA-binding transcriptional regulator AlpA
MESTSEGLDLIWGVEEIAGLIGRTERQTYHMIKKGHLPMVKQVGERYVASRQKLVAFFLEVA